MKDLKNKAELLIKIGKERAEKKRQRTVIVRRSFASIAGLCAAVALGAAIWNNESIKNAADMDKFIPSGILVQENTGSSDTGIVTTVHNADVVTAKATRSSITVTSTTGLKTVAINFETTTEIVPDVDIIADDIPQPDTVIPVQETAAVPRTFFQTTVIVTNPTTTTTTAVHGNDSSGAVNGNDPPVNQEKFYGVCRINDLNGNNYTGNNKMVPPEEIDRLICETEVNSEYYNSDMGRNERYSTISDVYSLKGFSENYVVAVKDETEGKYYLLENQNYFPDTLGALFNDCGFENNMAFRFAEYYTQHKLTKYSDPDDKHIKEMLFSERDLIPEKDSVLTSIDVEGMLILYCDMPLIYDKPISITVTTKGWLTVNLDENAIVFNIGVEKAEESIAPFIVQVQFNEQLAETTAAPEGTAVDHQI